MEPRPFWISELKLFGHSWLSVGLCFNCYPLLAKFYGSFLQRLTASDLKADVTKSALFCRIEDNCVVIERIS
jgi:hypothetical protein